MSYYRDGKWDFIYRTGKMEEIGGYISHVGQRAATFRVWDVGM